MGRRDGAQISLREERQDGRERGNGLAELFPPKLELRQLQSREQLDLVRCNLALECVRRREIAQYRLGRPFPPHSTNHQLEELPFPRVGFGRDLMGSELECDGFPLT